MSRRDAAEGVVQRRVFEHDYVVRGKRARSFAPRPRHHPSSAAAHRRTADRAPAQAQPGLTLQSPPHSPPACLRGQY